MPGDATEILRQMKTTDAVRASAWDAVYEATDSSDLQRRLVKLPLPNEVRAQLWDTRFGAGAQPETPTFRSENAKDAAGDAEVDPNTFGTFARHVGRQIDPRPMVQGFNSMVPIPKALGGGGMDAPGNALKFVQHSVFPTEILYKSKDALDKGDYVSAARHFIEYVLPVVGPMLSEAGDEMGQGKYAAGLGDAMGIGTALFGPAALSKMLVGVKSRAPMKNPNPLDREAVAFGHREGIPVDAATATGNRFVRTAQKVADESLLGSPVGQRARAAQDAALDTTGHRLADQSFPRAVTQEGAGQTLTSELAKKLQQHHEVADARYAFLREMEANPLYSETVQVDLPKPVRVAMREQLGSVPSGAEIQELRRIRTELDAVPFQQGKLSRDTGAGFDSGDSTYSNRAAGAPVYHDIMQEAGGTSQLSRADVQRSIDLALKTGRFTNGARGALVVAQKRLGQGGAEYSGMSRPILPPDAGEVVASMAIPVNIVKAKGQLKPIYQQLMRESELVPLQGGKARALTALDRLMTAPDNAPLSLVDGALSDLKSMARTSTPELRTPGQGIAAAAVRSLESDVWAAASKSGPEVVKALKEGRAATVSKYKTADVLDRLRAEPVQAFRQMTAPKDAGIDLLRTVKREVPQSMPEVARAYLDDLLNTATAEGGFKRTDKLWADWQKLGGETKLVLFPKNGQRAALDQFFLLAKRIGENPNPSGSGFTVLKGGELGLIFTNPGVGIPFTISGRVLSKLLHSPKVVRALTQGLSMTRGSKVSPSLYSTAVGRIVQAANEAGTPIPAAADRQPPQ